ncbi:putative taste receptor type 2 member 33 [Equus przewalskii]|uniref:Taste receptor type 2 n=1 Tax=Equus przewalskii TaxID=9798 RepID=A0ABM2EF41_EQUPR|nr:taste receptor type 2 member 46-like [Equus caballus]XP_008511765.1 PREDICTED: taste receptor type 2 member 46-like [Equus przewalskii]
MITLLPSIFSVLITTEFVLGNFANGFIALVNCIDWVKRQKMSSADQILTALAVSRIGLLWPLLWVILINWYMTVLPSVFHSLEVRIIVFIAWTVSNHLNIWLATSLSIFFYLLKIANFSSLIFLYLKWRVKSVLLVILLGASVFWVSHLAVLWVNNNVQTNEFEGNITQKTKLRDIVALSNLTLFTLVNFIHFSMSLTCFLLLIISLWKHLKKIQLNGKGSHDPSTKVHIRAMQTVVSFLLLYAVYFLALVILVWSSNRLESQLLVMLCRAFEILYPSSHSFILIWGNKKLRQALQNIRNIIRLPYY